MKKFLFFALILCMASCTVVEQPSTTMKTITVRVKATDWKYSNQGNNNYIRLAFADCAGSYCTDTFDLVEV